MTRGVGEKRIPTLVGLLLIAFGILGTSFLVQKLRPFNIGATFSEEPREIKITNVSSDSFTVSWLTQDKVIGSIRFWKEEKQESTLLDERDKPGSLGSYKTHSVTLQSLQPETRYYFVINSGKNSFDNNGLPYQITTGPKLSALGVQKISIKGSIIDETGSASKDSLIYLRLKNAQPLSTITSPRGEWVFSQEIRTADLQNYYEITSFEILDLLITNGDKSSNIKVNLGRAIPTVTLGQDYDFTIPDQGDKEATPSSQPSKFRVTPPAESVTAPLILTPKEEESFTDQKPRFSGSAPRGTTIKVIIESPGPIEVTIKADSNGNWSYRPQTPLPPGEHTITIVAPDSTKILRTITRRFKVFAAGTQVSESATPSATPTTKPSPTPTPTVVATPTATPTKILTPTPTSLPIPTKAPKPLPVAGESLPFIVLGAIGVMTFLVGLVLLF